MKLQWCSAVNTYPYSVDLLRSIRLAPVFGLYVANQINIFPYWEVSVRM